jgi:hypothetical protein
MSTHPCVPCSAISLNVEHELRLRRFEDANRGLLKYRCLLPMFPAAHPMCR